MADPRFFAAAPPRALRSIASDLGLECRGPADGVVISGVAPLSMAGRGDIAQVTARSYLAAAWASEAGAFLIPSEMAGDMPPDRAVLIAADPRLQYARIAALFFPEPPVEPGIAADATVAPGAKIAPGARVESGAVIGADAVIGAGSVIGAGACLGRAVVIGARCSIGPRTTLTHALIGSDVRILPGAAIGQDGFGYVLGPDGLERVPQLGRVVIEDNVDIGANTTIDRGAGADTVIGTGTKIDNQVQIGHNCRIGRHCVIAAHSGISGSVTIGDFVQLGGKAGIADHVTIGSRARVAAGAGVMRDIPEGEVWGGLPARPMRVWHRESIALSRLARPGARTRPDREE